MNALEALNAYQATSKSYQADCNLRRLKGVPDEKRLKLRKSVDDAMKIMCEKMKPLLETVE